MFAKRVKFKDSNVFQKLVDLSNDIKSLIAMYGEVKKSNILYGYGKPFEYGYSAEQNGRRYLDLNSGQEWIYSTKDKAWWHSDKRIVVDRSQQDVKQGLLHIIDGRDGLVKFTVSTTEDNKLYISDAAKATKVVLDQGGNVTISGTSLIINNGCGVYSSWQNPIAAGFTDAINGSICIVKDSPNPLWIKVAGTWQQQKLNPM